MASHANTPASVLHAPTSRPLLISDQSGLSRAERRRLMRVVDKNGEFVPFPPMPTANRVPKALQLPATNVPFTGKVADAAAEALAAQATSVSTNRSLASRVKSLMTFGAGRRTKDQAQTPVTSHKGRGILGRGRAGSR